MASMMTRTLSRGTPWPPLTDSVTRSWQRDRAGASAWPKPGRLLRAACPGPQAGGRFSLGPAMSMPRPPCDGPVAQPLPWQRGHLRPRISRNSANSEIVRIGSLNIDWRQITTGLNRQRNSYGRSAHQRTMRIVCRPTLLGRQNLEKPREPWGNLGEIVVTW